MCLKNNKPARLEKKSSLFDDWKEWSTPEMWTIIGFIILFLIFVFIAFLNRNAFWYNVPL